MQSLVVSNLASQIVEERVSVAARRRRAGRHCRARRVLRPWRARVIPRAA